MWGCIAGPWGAKKLPNQARSGFSASEASIGAFCIVNSPTFTDVRPFVILDAWVRRFWDNVRRCRHRSRASPLFNAGRPSSEITKLQCWVRWLVVLFSLLDSLVALPRQKAPLPAEESVGEGGIDEMLLCMSYKCCCLGILCGHSSSIVGTSRCYLADVSRFSQEYKETGTGSKYGVTNEILNSFHSHTCM
jgi:hypothetical protein